jgi:hypothetical protein
MRGTLDRQVGDERIRQARITYRNGTEIYLRDVTVRSDSVIGFADDGRERRAIPYGEVAAVERQQISVVRTGAVVLLTAAVATVAFIVSAFAQLDENWSAAPMPAPPAR